MDKIICPLCEEKYTKIEALHSHIEEEHSDNIPEGYSPQQYLYFMKTGKTCGHCVQCKQETGWNETTGKYKRFCDNPKCKDQYRELFKQRMVGKYGKTTLLNDPNHQRKMLANRHISGKYVWTDGTEKTYTGSYEHDFLRMLDLFMNFDSDDVMTPSPHTYYYMYNNEKKFYIPDVYIPSLNLEIEIKDGGDNPNMHGKIQAVDKVKEKLKDDVMASQKEYGYIKVVNKNYDNFFKYLLDMKKKVANSKNTPLGIIKESTDIVTDGWFDIKKMCENAPIIKDEAINDTIEYALANGHKVYVGTDWHLWKCKDSRIYKNPAFDDILLNVSECVGENDVFIFLGDFVDDEFNDKNALKNVLINLPGVKILCKGNNDLFSDEFYMSCGFKHVSYKFVWRDIVFSHMPTSNNYKMNIHGHIHGMQKYFIPYTNQIDVFNTGYVPLELSVVIKNLKNYSKHVTVDLSRAVKESYEPVLEVSKSSRDIDQYFDFERFVNSDSNLLFITGLIGSSKKLLAREYATEFKAKVINLDLFTKTAINEILTGNYMGDLCREYIDILIDYASNVLPHDPENPTMVQNPTDNQKIDFINEVIKRLRNKGRYIIEGVYLYRYAHSITDLMTGYPIIICQDSIAQNLRNIKLQPTASGYALVNDESDDFKRWILSERKMINDFIDDVVSLRSNVNNMKYHQKKYPVYVVLSHSGTTLANIIKKVTGDEYSHAMISFDSSLRNMYSFGQNTLADRFEAGMVHSDISEALYRRPVPYSVYVTFVDVEEYKEMKKRLYTLLATSKKLKYDFVGLIKYALGHPEESRNKMFCSQFVANVIDPDGNRTGGKKPHEIKPEDFKYMSEFHLVQRGLLTEYNPAVTDERTRQLMNSIR